MRNLKERPVQPVLPAKNKTLSSATPGPEATDAPAYSPAKLRRDALVRAKVYVASRPVQLQDFLSDAVEAYLNQLEHPPVSTPAA